MAICRTRELFRDRDTNWNLLIFLCILNADRCLPFIKISKKVKSFIIPRFSVQNICLRSTSYHLSNFRVRTGTVIFVSNNARCKIEIMMVPPTDQCVKRRCSYAILSAHGIRSVKSEPPAHLVRLINPNAFAIAREMISRGKCSDLYTYKIKILIENIGNVSF